MNKTLYTKDNLGRTRIWYMEQQGSKHRTVSGLLNGELVTSAWTECEPKNVGKANATSGEEQATKEIEAKYKKQLKTGYFENQSDIDCSLYVEPMLAKLYKDYEHKIDLKDWLLQCKFNGMRCVATKDGLFTRKGEQYKSCPHIQDTLRPFFEKHPNAVLDGELFNEEYRQQLNEIAKLIRKTKNISAEDLKKSKELIQYHIYDGYGFDGLSQKVDYVDRKGWIDSNIDYDHIVLVEDHLITSKEELIVIYQKLVDRGHEGGILRKKKSPYENKRSQYLLKIKPEDDAEAVIVDILEGTGNWAGAGKVIRLKWNGIEFDSSFKGTYEESADFLCKKADWIGKEVTFVYNGLTGLGVPNFARVDIKNCLKK